MLNEKTDMESILVPKQEETDQGSSMQHERAIRSLQMVKEFVHKSFGSRGVIANLIFQNGQEPYLNVSNISLTLNMSVSSHAEFQEDPESSLNSKTR